MTFAERYIRFSGRASRTEFWWSALVLWLLMWPGQAVLTMAVWPVFPDSVHYLMTIYWVAIVIPMCSVGARRLHDTDRTGMMLLWAFIPIIGHVVLLVLWCWPSTPHPNRFGPVPNRIKIATPPKQETTTSREELANRL